MTTPQLSPDSQPGAAVYDGTAMRELARENAELKELLGGPDQWRVTAGYLKRAQQVWEDREARRWLNAQGWQAPPAGESLAVELARPRETAPQRIPGLAGWNHNVLVAGPRKTGKTQLEVNLAAALSMSSWTPFPLPPQADRRYPRDGQFTAGRFLGLTDCYMAGNLAYVNAEMDPDDWRDVFRALPAGTYDASRIFPVHCRGVPLPVITNGTARAWFTSWLIEHQIEVLIIDTWGAFCAKNGVRDFNDDGPVRPILDALDEIKRETWVASIMVLIHTPHQVPGMKHLERFKGAGAVGDWADTLWNYVRDDEGTRYLSATGRARIDQPESSLYFDQATGLLSWGASGSREQTAASRQRERIMKALGAARPDGMKAEDLKDAAGGHRDAAARTITAMVEDGIVVIERRGNAKIHRLRQEHPTTGQISGQQP